MDFFIYSSRLHALWLSPTLLCSPGTESWKISFEEHVVIYLSQKVQVSLCWLYVLSVVRSPKRSWIHQHRLCFRLAARWDYTDMYRCMCCWWYVTLFSTFPPVFLLLMYLFIFREKARAGEIFLFVRKLKYGVIPPFLSIFIALLVEQRDSLELLVPGCLYSCCHQQCC